MKTRLTNPVFFSFVVALSVSLYAGGAWSATSNEQVGRALAARGTVVATGEGGSARSLSRGALIYERDTIEVRRGRVQIRFADGAMVTLDDGARLAVSQYDVGAAAAGESKSAEREQEKASGGSVVMRLFEGAMRTVTGAVGDDANDQYRMETPTATLGVRGTQYALEYCEAGSCNADGANGLYGQVVDGQVSVQNKSGSATFAAGDYFAVGSQNAVPATVVRPPGDVLSNVDTSSSAGGGDAADASGSDKTDGERLTGEEQPRGGSPDADSNETETETEKKDELAFEEEFEEQETSGDSSQTELELSLLSDAGVAVGFAGTDSSGDALALGGTCRIGNNCGAQTDSDERLRSATASTDFGELTVTAPQDATSVDTGNVTTSEFAVRWGRWTDGIDVSIGGTSSTLDGSALWAYSQTPTDLDGQFDGTGGIRFNTIGGPSPYGTQNGADWSVSALTVDVTFEGGAATVPVGGVFLSLTNESQPSANSVKDLYSLRRSTLDPSADSNERLTVALGGALPSFDGSNSNPNDVSLDDLEDAGVLSANFLGDSSSGLLTSFTVFDRNSDGDLIEQIQGTKVLGDETTGVLSDETAVASGMAGITEAGELGAAGGTCIVGSGCTGWTARAGNSLVYLATNGVSIYSTAGSNEVQTGTTSDPNGSDWEVTWGRWRGVSSVTNEADSEFSLLGGTPWAYSGSPTTATELQTVFEGKVDGDTTSYADVGGPSPVGAVGTSNWGVTTLSATLQFSSGTAEVVSTDLVLDNTSSGATISLANDGTTTIDPSTGDRGFSIALKDTSSPDQGSLQAKFLGANADGLLAEFEAEKIDSNGDRIEVIEGVRVLAQ